MPRICEAIFCTDWHLNKLSRFFNDHLEKQREELRKPFLYALRNGIKTVIVGGDISEDPQLEGPALTVLLSILIEFDGKLDIYIILGNHDFAHTEAHSLQPLSKLCEHRKFKTVRVYEKPTHVEIDGVHFNMLPFPATHKLKPYKDGPAVNVAHLEWEGAVRDNGVSRIKGGYRDNSKGRDVWLIGHLHTAQYIEKDRVLYCGTQFQTNFGENADKSFCHVKFRYKGDKLLFKFTRIPQRCAFTLHNVEITDSKQFAQLSPDPNQLYKLWIAPDVKVPKNLLMEMPNILDTVGIKAEEQEQATLEVKALDINLTTGLKDLLKARGLDKPQIKRARSILRELGV